MTNDIKTVCVFGASGRQGIAQINALLEHGYWPRGIMRDPKKFPIDVPDGLALMAADYKDEGALERAMTGADAVFLTPPSFTEVGKGFANAVRVATIAKAAGVKRLILNTSMYVPDEPMGEPIYDGRLALEDALEATGIALTVFRPVLFMDNLLTDWVRPKLASEGKFIYPHNPTMQANWICLDDVGQFMTKALADDSLIGERMVIGGPDTYQPTDVATVLAEVLGKDVIYEQSTTRAFGTLLNDIFGDVIDLPRDVHIGSIEAFYDYNNASNRKPMVVDMAPVLERIPVKLTSLKDWAANQDWAPRSQGGPAPVGG